MSVERSKVLPKGYYWIDTIGAERTRDFLAWRSAHRSAVAVRGTREHTQGRELPSGAEPRTWFLFEVLSPVAWLPAERFGFPNHGKAGMQEGDTVELGDVPKDATDQLADELKPARLVEGLKTFSWIFGLALGVYGLTKLRK